MGSLPDVQPEHLHQAALAAELQRSSTNPNERLPAAQPRDPERRADRLDVQADHRHRGARERRLDHRATPTTTPGQFCIGPADVPPQRRPRRRRRRSTSSTRSGSPRTTSSTTSGALTNADPRTHPNGGALQQWARAFGIGQPTGIDLPRRGRRHAALAALAGQRNKLEAECENAHRPVQGPAASTPGLRDRRRHNRPWSVGDNDQPRRRPGRRPGHAAAARGRLLGARQRRHDRPPPPRPRHPERRRHRAAEDRPAAGAPHRHQPALPGRRSARACATPPRSRAAPRTTCWATSPSRSTARRAPPSTHGQPDYSWYACFVPRPRPASRSWSWCTSSRAASAPSPRRRWRARSCRSGSSASRAPYVAGTLDRRYERDRRSRPARRSAVRAPAALHADRSAAAAGGARAGRVLAGHAQGRHRARGPRPPALLRRAPGDLRRHRAADRAAAEPDRLLAAARVQVRAVRG